MVLTKTCGAPPLDVRKVLRYAGCKDGDDALRALAQDCFAEAGRVLSYKVCYLPLSVRIDGDFCDLGVCGVRSSGLAKNLAGCDRAILFAATVGIGLDRLIARFGARSPARAVMLDALGVERIEALCDAFCEEIAQAEGGFARPRFSPGYGDLDLSFQTEIFALLDCQKRIGLSMTDSLMMSPSKSVTAIMGLSDGGCADGARKCEVCENRECSFRSDV